MDLLEQMLTAAGSIIRQKSQLDKKISLDEIQAYAQLAIASQLGRLCDLIERKPGGIG